MCGQARYLSVPASVHHHASMGTYLLATILNIDISIPFSSTLFICRGSLMRSLFETQLPSDVAGVLKTAALLDTTEYRVFELAYRNWYGLVANDTQIESFFIAYMFKDNVPLWVRQFTRHTIQRSHTQGVTVDDLRQPISDPASIAKGVRFLLVVAGVLAFMLILAENTGYLSSVTQECYFPPCY